MEVTAATIAAFLGQPDNPELLALAGEALPVVTAMARAYTRDQGHWVPPDDDLAAVITTATARLVANPEQLGHTIGSVNVYGGFTGWTLPELFVLNRYRARAL